EEKRVLYVAMTRAKERLILTSALKDDDKSYMGLITQSVRDVAGIELGDKALLSENSHTKKNEDLSPSPNPSHPGRGNSGDLPPGEENKTSEEDKTGPEKFPLPLRERVRVRGISKGKCPLGNSEIFVEHFWFDGTHRPAKPTRENKMDIDWTAFVEIWKKRETAMIEATRKSLFVSPSAITDEETIVHDMLPVPGRVERASETHPNYAALIGSICHRVLEEWDFHGSPQGLQRSVESVVKWNITFGKGEVESPAQFQGESISISPPSQGGDAGVVMKSKEIPPHTMQTQDVEFVKAEVIKILSNFVDSEAYKELQDAQILGREIPILLKWNGQIMRGTIDIIYKIGNRLIIGDYKTDIVKPSDLLARAEKYQHQREVYVEAVKRCLNIDNPEFKLIFLRIGKAITI
ncbi:MAG TPA: hypothetical protein ACFYD9_04310, partial [Candidatus Wunengus sp. YC64]|uniref:hypothetical protein n=1 Tax=Candidatus Wunengus sp. YC64 TaxID=3367700 RepID=UPI004029BB2A